ncbi:MAG: helix-turn-helix transcriptional regulator [Oscillospiraceae bacterium]|nr:helix-turn-helix transcriptional regulator [Oscillospiraceae bacterium]
MNIGERLRNARNNRGFSIYKLNQITGISQNHISAVELGKRQPSLELVERLVTPLGVTMSELLSNDGEVFYLTEEEKVLVRNFRVMENERRGIFYALGGALAE